MPGELAETPKQKYDRRLHQYTEFTNKLAALVEDIVHDAKIDVESVTHRVKSFDRVERKLQRRQQQGLDEVRDICGVRVVTHFLADVDRVVALVKDEFEVVEHQTRGPHAAEQFGYVAQHLLIRLGSPRSNLPEWRRIGRGLVAEIQVRSFLQHAWANISRQLDYQSDSMVPESVRRRLFRVAALLEASDEMLDDFRDRVGRLRMRYEEVSGGGSQDAWRLLPLDLDSVRASATRLKADQVVRKAVRAGFRPLRYEVQTGDARIDRGVQRLLQVAPSLGLGTIGDVEQAVGDLLRDDDLLARFASEATDAGQQPFALWPDVVTFFLLLRSRSPVPFEVLLEGGERFSSMLLDTAKEIAVPPGPSERAPAENGEGPRTGR
jgi:ppGpp synthetase/RelA/SpoT-type nucleotidyltranferase